MNWPLLLLGKSTGTKYYFEMSATGLCAQYRGPLGIIFITEQDVKDKLWLPVSTNTSSTHF